MINEKTKVGVVVEPGDIITKSDGTKFVVVTEATYVRGNTQYGKEKANDLPTAVNRRNALPFIPMFNIDKGRFRWTRQFSRYEKDGKPVIGFDGSAA